MDEKDITGRWKEWNSSHLRKKSSAWESELICCNFNWRSSPPVSSHLCSLLLGSASGTHWRELEAGAHFRKLASMKTAVLPKGSMYFLRLNFLEIKPSLHILPIHKKHIPALCMYTDIHQICWLTLIFHFCKFFVVLLKSFPKFLVLCFNIVHALDFQLELLPQIQSRNRIWTT